MSEYIIKSAHEKLFSFGRGAAKTPGQYKTEQNYLVDRTKRNILFIPISPIKLQEGTEKLFSYIKDGNERIGRMLITLMLWNEGVISAPHFYISSYFEEHKNEYIDIMKNVSANNDWTPWVIFF
ncbi:hypothetical protein [Sulfurimonas sp.]|uniref:Fic family protein n=1 Tax=Sulfurimonas sp. TaxID=2022749 RepID=UPI0025F92DBB|nr:hypothetical protein [Sulfurimonas sp.]MCK9454028.1 hypothetical protein [Sulfurimonas sp.]